MSDIQLTFDISQAAGDDLFWLSCLYVEGELTQSQADQFDDRLAVDQAARESVAAAAELTAATRLALVGQSQPLESSSLMNASKPSRVNDGWKRVAQVLSLVTACLLAVIVYLAPNQPATVGKQDASGADRGKADAASDSHLAELWASQLEAVDSDLMDLPNEFDVVLDDADSSGDLASVEPFTSSVTTDPIEIESSGWMLEALSVSIGQDEPEASNDEGAL